MKGCMRSTRHIVIGLARTQAAIERVPHTTKKTVRYHLLARQAGGRPAAVVSSNAGQVLWGGLATAARAARVAERLLAPDMFSGWGIRTLSAEAKAYNPMSYHLGSVWPHDNSLIVNGFRLYDRDAAALRVFDALFDAASNFQGYRLPELFSGYDRSESEQRPIAYPVACSPQAWDREQDRMRAEVHGQEIPDRYHVRVDLSQGTDALEGLGVGALSYIPVPVTRPGAPSHDPVFGCSGDR